MKSILISSYAPDPSLLSPTDIPTPSPARDEYLVRVTHCSPQHADILHAQGKHQNNNPKRGWCFPPFTLGYDFAGIVQSIPEQQGAKERTHKVENHARLDEVDDAEISRIEDLFAEPEEPFVRRLA